MAGFLSAATWTSGAETNERIIFRCELATNIAAGAGGMRYDHACHWLNSGSATMLCLKYTLTVGFSRRMARKDALIVVEFERSIGRQATACMTGARNLYWRSEYLSSWLITIAVSPPSSTFSRLEVGIGFTGVRTCGFQ